MGWQLQGPAKVLNYQTFAQTQASQPEDKRVIDSRSIKLPEDAAFDALMIQASLLGCVRRRGRNEPQPKGSPIDRPVVAPDLSEPAGVSRNLTRTLRYSVRKEITRKQSSAKRLPLGICNARERIGRAAGPPGGAGPRVFISAGGGCRVAERIHAGLRPGVSRPGWTLGISSPGRPGWEIEGRPAFRPP
jgi:hypothetical protein